MPFEFSVARAFKVTSIRAHAPASPGVYGISNALEWIFVGQSDNIQMSLLRHLTDPDQTSLIGRQPTGFAFELCGAERQADRCERLILEYSPVCNYRPSVRRVGESR
jgi:hypothetical protein